MNTTDKYTLSSVRLRCQPPLMHTCVHVKYLEASHLSMCYYRYHRPPFSGPGKLAAITVNRQSPYLHVQIYCCYTTSRYGIPSASSQQWSSPCLSKAVRMRALQLTKEPESSANNRKQVSIVKQMIEVSAHVVAHKAITRMHARTYSTIAWSGSKHSISLYIKLTKSLKEASTGKTNGVFKHGEWFYTGGTI